MRRATHHTVTLDVVREDRLEDHEVDQVPQCNDGDHVHRFAQSVVDLKETVGDQPASLVARYGRPKNVEQKQESGQKRDDRQDLQPKLDLKHFQRSALVDSPVAHHLKGLESGISKMIKVNPSVRW